MQPDPKTLADLALSRPGRTLDAAADAGAPADDGTPATRKAARLAVQACLDAGRVLVRTPIRVTVPPGLAFDRPLYVPGYVRLAQSSPCTIIDPGLKFPWSHGLILGMGPAPMGVAVDPADLVPSDTLLDGSLKGRFGVRLREHQTIAELGGLFSELAGKVDQALTLDIIYSTAYPLPPPPSGGPPELASVPAGRGLAIGSSEGDRPAPLVISVDHDTGEVLVLACGPGPRRAGRVTIPGLKTPGVHRVAVQVSATKDVALLIADGISYLVPLGLPPGKLNRAARVPFKVGGLGPSPAYLSDYYTIPPQDALVLGIAATAAERYRWTTGKPARADDPDAPINDYWRVGPLTGRVSLLLDDDPADVRDTRTLRSYDGRFGTVFLLDAKHDFTVNQGSEAAVETHLDGVGVQAAGDAVTIGLALDAKLTDCNLAASPGSAIGSWRLGVTYTHELANLDLRGDEAAIALDGAMATLDHVRWLWTGRWGVYATNSSLTADHLTVGGWESVPGTCEAIVRLDGGRFVGNNMAIDIEGAGFPRDALFDLQSRSDAANSAGVLLSLSHLGIGTIPAGASLIRARCDARGRGGVIRLDCPVTSGVGNAGGVLLDCDGGDGAWDTRLDAASLIGGNPALWPMARQPVGGGPPEMTPPPSPARTDARP